LSAVRDMKDLGILYAEDNLIESLVSFKKLVDLKELNLANNQITELSFLSEIEPDNSFLWLADFSSNQITNLDGVGNLSNVKILSLSQNLITDIKPLANLTDLVTLLIDDNQITSLKDLSQLPNLKAIYASKNLIDDTNGVVEMTQLVELYLYENKINAEQQALIRSSLADTKLEL